MVQGQMTSTVSASDKQMMKKMHMFDNVIGYKYGQFMWFAFWIPSLVVLLCDDTPGSDRDFLTHATLLSSITLLYYSHHQDKGSPASTPGTHALFGELLARWILFAHHVPSQVINNSTIGVMNWVQIICMGVFTLSKLPVGIYTTWNHKSYKAIVDDLKESEKIY